VKIGYKFQSLGKISNLTPHFFQVSSYTGDSYGGVIAKRMF